MTDFALVTKCDRYESMADNILYLNISLVISKCLFEVCLFEMDGMDDKIAMIAMRRRIFRENVPTTSNAQLSCIASLKLCGRFVAHIPIRVFEECTLQLEL